MFLQLLKVLCFDTLLEVFILKGMLDLRRSRKPGAKETSSTTRQTGITAAISDVLCEREGEGKTDALFPRTIIPLESRTGSARQITLRKKRRRGLKSRPRRADIDG